MKTLEPNSEAQIWKLGVKGFIEDLLIAKRYILSVISGIAAGSTDTASFDTGIKLNGSKNILLDNKVIWCSSLFFVYKLLR